MAPNNIVALAAAVREALAAPKSLVATSNEEREARLDLIDMVPELNAALIGDANVLRELSWSGLQLAPLHFISRLEVAKHVPLDSGISYEDLAAKCGTPENILRRMLRLAMTSRLFSEKDGKVWHSSTSRLVLEDQRLAAFVDLNTETAFQTLSRMTDALQRWPNSRSPRETGFSLAIGRPGEISMFEEIGKDPVRKANFGRAMELFSTGEGYEATSLVESYPWAKLGNGTVVDVGGANGFVSAAIKKAFPSLRVIVQDIAMSDAIKADNADANLEWMAHDYFTPQTVVADVYFYRFVFHNNPDDKAINILRAAIPALKPGARILINDGGLPDPGEAHWYDEKAARGLDILMLAVMNGRERGKDDWKALFTAADPRYKFLGATLPPRTRLFLIEAEWTG